MLKINLKLLAENLKEEPELPPPDHKKKLGDLSTGAAYLYEKVVSELLCGNCPNSAELDMDAFDLVDYEILEEYYRQNLASDRPEMKKLSVLYQGLLKSHPVGIRTAFI